MAPYSDKVSWWADWLCDTQKMERVTFPGWSTGLLVADASMPAWEIFAALMRTHGYNFREAAGGTYNCRKISGSDSWSLHAYGIAIDLNPSANPYGTHTHDYPQGFIDDVLATGLFKWGIDFDDPMHWEIDVPPSTIGDDMGHPYDGHKAFRKDHDIGSVPDWSPWDKYVEAGGSSVPESGTWAFTRADMAWVWSAFIRPLESKVAQLTERVRQLENQGHTEGVSEAQVKAIIDGSQIVAPD